MSKKNSVILVCVALVATAAVCYFMFSSKSPWHKHAKSEMVEKIPLSDYLKKHEINEKDILLKVENKNSQSIFYKTSDGISAYNAQTGQRYNYLYEGEPVDLKGASITPVRMEEAYVTDGGLIVLEHTKSANNSMAMLKINASDFDMQCLDSFYKATKMQGRIVLYTKSKVEHTGCSVGDEPIYKYVTTQYSRSGKKMKGLFNESFETYTGKSGYLFATLKMKTEADGSIRGIYSLSKTQDEYFVYSFYGGKTQDGHIKGTAFNNKKKTRFDLDLTLTDNHLSGTAAYSIFNEDEPMTGNNSVSLCKMNGSKPEENAQEKNSYTPQQYVDFSIDDEDFDEEEDSEDDDNEVYTHLVEKASFPGGTKSLNKFFSENLQYPADADVQGTVILSIVVNKDGSISDIVVKRSLSSALDEEAIRCVKTMPKWEPGKNHGKKVRSRYELPVTFKL